MSSSAAKVAEIFTAAGEAFSYLGNLTMQLHPLDGDYVSCNSSRAKWGEEEIELLRGAVTRFGEDLKKISEQVKTKSVAQIKAALKKGLLDQNAAQANKKKALTSQRSPTNGEPTAKRQKTTESLPKRPLYNRFTDASTQISKPSTSAAAPSVSPSLSEPVLLAAVTTPIQSTDIKVEDASVSHQTDNEGVLPV